MLSVEPETIVIRLELRVADTPLTGRASTATAPARDFTGWLGLVAAIDGLIACRPSEENG
jgi:hypothetical protein